MKNKLLMMFAVLLLFGLAASAAPVQVSWNTQTNTMDPYSGWAATGTLYNLGAQINSMAVLPDGNAVIQWNTQMFVLDTATGSMVAGTYIDFGTNITKVVTRPDGNVVVARNSYISSYNPYNGWSTVGSEYNLGATIKDVAVLTDGNAIVTWGAGANTQLYGIDLSTGTGIDGTHLNYGVDIAAIDGMTNGRLAIARGSWVSCNDPYNGYSLVGNEYNLGASINKIAALDDGNVVIAWGGQMIVVDPSTGGTVSGTHIDWSPTTFDSIDSFVPEPTSMALLATGAILCVSRRRCHVKK